MKLFFYLDLSKCTIEVAITAASKVTSRQAGEVINQLTSDATFVAKAPQLVIEVAP